MSAVPPFSDPEKARAAGLRSAEVRARRDLTPEQQIEAELPRLTACLLDAALGRGSFGELKPADRLKALQTALAYGLGRPGARQEPETAPEPPSAASLFGSAPAE
jgi:hypothetical protein